MARVRRHPAAAHLAHYKVATVQRGGDSHQQTAVRQVAALKGGRQRRDAIMRPPPSSVVLISRYFRRTRRAKRGS